MKHPRELFNDLKLGYYPLKKNQKSAQKNRKLDRNQIRRQSLRQKLMLGCI